MLKQTKKPDDSLQIKRCFIQKSYSLASIISLTFWKKQLEIVSENISLLPKTKMNG